MDTGRLAEEQAREDFLDDVPGPPGNVTAGSIPPLGCPPAVSHGQSGRGQCCADPSGHVVEVSVDGALTRATFEIE